MQTALPLFENQYIERPFRFKKPLLAALVATALATSQSLGQISIIAPTTANWNRVSSGAWSESPEGLQVNGSGFRLGNSISSKNTYDFTDAVIYVKWKPHGAGSYMSVWFRVDPLEISAGYFTTNHSWLNSTVLQDDTWYYSRFQFSGKTNCTTVTSTGNYDDSGGTVFFTNTQTISPNASLDNFMVFGFNDNYGGTSSSATLGEVKIVKSASEAGKVTLISGIVTVMRNGLQQPLTENSPVYKADLIKTEASSYIKITTLDGSIISVAPNSIFRIDELEPSPAGFLTILKGKLRAWAMKHLVESPFIKTPTAALANRGTEFEVEYEENGGVATTNVSVFEGIVDVTENATERISTIAAGETLRILSNIAGPTASIIGGWSLPDGDGGSTVTFLPNGEYLFFRDGDSISIPGAQDGMERGTYSWNPQTGALSAIVLVDTNGEWGFSHGVALQPSVPAAVGETSLEIIVPGEGTSTFSQVKSLSSPLVGSWYVVGGTRAGGMAAITFLADGSYYFAQDGDPAKDPTGTDGGERGSFTWDSGTGKVTAIAAVDTCGQWGLSHLGANLAAVLRNNSRTLILSGGNLAEPVTFQRVSAFDGSFESWKATHALFGAKSEATATPFGDGIPNVLRYALNLDISYPPPGHLPLGQVIDISGTNHLEMEFRVRKNLDGSILTPQFSTTLNNWQPVPSDKIHRLADDDVNTERHIVRMPLLGPSLFLRLAATESNP